MPITTAPTIWPPATTLAPGDNALPISPVGVNDPTQPVGGVRVQNNLTVPVQLAYDTPASLGAITVAAGQLWTDDAIEGKGLLSVLHIWVASGTPVVNGAVAGLAVWGVL